MLKTDKKNNMKPKMTPEKELQGLEKQAKQIEAKKQALELRIQKQKDKNKPKSIMDRVKSFKDALKIAKPSKEELALLYYKGTSKTLCFARDFSVLELISRVLNEGWEPKMDGSDNRYYPWFHLPFSSGFDFDGADYDDALAFAGSASRLCLKSSELAAYAAKTFKKEYETAIKGLSK